VGVKFGKREFQIDAANLAAFGEQEKHQQTELLAQPHLHSPG